MLLIGGTVPTMTLRDRRYFDLHKTEIILRTARLDYRKVRNNIKSGSIVSDCRDTPGAHRCQLNAKPLHRLLFDD